jgi:hypothetical protein
MWTAYGFKTFLKLLRFLATISSFGALHTKSSRRFYESPRRIDNCLIETLMLLLNILGETLNWLSIILVDSTNLREVLTPFAAFLGEPLTQTKEKLENRVLNCQSFSEILRISEKIWYGTHQNLKLLSKIEETSLKFKNQKRFPFRPIWIHSSQKITIKISCDSPFKFYWYR